MARNKQADVHSQGKCHRHGTTIDMLVDDALLQIFDFCRKMHYNWPQWRPRPEWDWLILVHVCRRWRRIIFDSPRRLDLRILCTYGTPVRTSLGIWPAFPIDLKLESPAALKPEDVDNAIAALEHRGRVSTVRVFAYGSDIGKMAAVMQEPFPALTCLSMRSCHEDTLVLTADFLGGSAPRLQTITLYRIPFTALPTLLLSTSDLDTLNLFDVTMQGYISPKKMAACLASFPRLTVFAITYQGHVDSRPRRIRPPPITRPILPALSDFSFQGAFEYLEDLVARIDCPQLERISAIYVSRSPRTDNFQVTQVSDFIGRSIGPSWLANVRFQFDRLTFTLSHEYANPGYDRRSIATTISYALVYFQWRQPDIARVLNQFSALFGTVVHLQLDAEPKETAQSDDAHDVEWLHLLRLFPAMQTLYIYLKLAAAVVLALENITAELVAEVLPSLGLMCLEGGPASSLEKLVATRRFPDQPIIVVETAEEFIEKLESLLYT